MGTGRKFAKKPRTRPKKKASERRRRQRLHKKRLIALGVPEAKVSKMDPDVARALLRRPALAARKVAGSSKPT
jgi:hypothetical protein